MEPNVKRELTNLSKRDYFDLTFKKLILNEDMSNIEKSFILSCAIIFLKFYEKDRRCRSYLELAYYLILKYSLNTGDYKPLFDFSLTAGFFPTVNYILKNNLIDNTSLQNTLIYESLDDYKDSNNKYIQTLEQHNRSIQLLNDPSKKKCYLAPTSYGKSSMMVDYIKKYPLLDKIAIIVPTKSLLNQTYKLIKNNISDRKIFTHHEMYTGEKKFIGILTQERALKFLEKNTPESFDLLFIDEAHNLFDSKSRNILLSRLIKKNQRLNSNQEVIYLSPLIENANNLKIFDNDSISSNLIRFNIKEPSYYEYSFEGNIFSYNHFLNEFYKLGNMNNKFQYILENSLHKNFLFENNPRKIELLALELSKNFEKINSPELEKLKKIIIEETNENFHMVKLLDYGIIYLHGKLPTLIKDYLEEKFNQISDLKFIIANTVILEGINLPIDNMYIINSHGVSMKQLVNLIGRVNRLNLIFSETNSSLNKLNPSIHFINKKYYSDHNPKLKKLRNRVFKDEVRNPTLINKNTTATKKEQMIKYNETFLDTEPDTPFNKLKKYFITNSLDEYYGDLNSAIKSYMLNASEFNFKNFLERPSIIDLIYIFFIKNSEENILNSEFARLEHEPTRKYYSSYIDITSKLELKKAIIQVLEHLIRRGKSEQPLLYFGYSYGERPYNSSRYEKGNDVYVDLSSKDKYELINLSIVKIKMEEDFISFTLNKFAEALFDLKIITEKDKDEFIYGSTNKSEMNLFKFGVSKKIIRQLKSDSQIENIFFDEHGNLSYNEEFKKYLDNLNEFNKFELNKYF